MTQHRIVNQERMILKLVVEEPSKWTTKKLSTKFGVPITTMKQRVRHLRGAGFLQPLNHNLTATTDGIHVYNKLQAKVTDGQMQ